MGISIDNMCFLIFCCDFMQKKEVETTTIPLEGLSTVSMGRCQRWPKAKPSLEHHCLESPPRVEDTCPIPNDFLRLLNRISIYFRNIWKIFHIIFHFSICSWRVILMVSLCNSNNSNNCAANGCSQRIPKHHGLAKPSGGMNQPWKSFTCRADILITKSVAFRSMTFYDILWHSMTSLEKQKQKRRQNVAQPSNDQRIALAAFRCTLPIGVCCRGSFSAWHQMRHGSGK